MLHHQLHPVVERGHVLFFVVKRNNNGIFRHPKMIRPPARDFVAAVILSGVTHGFIVSRAVEEPVLSLSKEPSHLSCLA